MRAFLSLTRGFTLIELLAAVAIVATLITLIVPVSQKMISSADNVKCSSNLRQVITVIQTAALDNDNRFPRIENDPSDPIHTDSGGSKPQTLAELVKAQGVSTDILKCPADIRNGGSATGQTASYYKSKGSSYEWLPFFEGEQVSNPTIRAPFGQFTVPLSRVRLLMDYVESGEGPHDRGVATSSMNVAYADGSVRKVVLDDDDTSGGPP